MRLNRAIITKICYEDNQQRKQEDKSWQLVALLTFAQNWFRWRQASLVQSAAAIDASLLAFFFVSTFVLFICCAARLYAATCVHSVDLLNEKCSNQSTIHDQFDRTASALGVRLDKRTRIMIQFLPAIRKFNDIPPSFNDE